MLLSNKFSFLTIFDFEFQIEEKSNSSIINIPVKELKTGLKDYIFKLSHEYLSVTFLALILQQEESQIIFPLP
jgi:hypothetical protein